MSLHKTPFIVSPPYVPSITLPNSHSDQKAIGEQLWSALGIDDAFDAACKASGVNILPIVIQSDDARVLQLPWETLYHKKFGFLATNPQFALSRSAPIAASVATIPKKEPLRVLLFSTLPDDLEENERLAVEHERIAVLEALLPSIKQGFVTLKIPNDGRFESLKFYIDDFKPHLVFLSGHSSYREGKGYFLFENKRGFGVYIDEENLTTAFIGSTVSCVALSSCQSAQADNDKPGSGLAGALAFRGIAHSIGMRDSIYDKAGAVFVEQFMKALSKQKPVAQAVQDGREAISKIENTEIAAHWSLPLLLSQDVYAPLVDWGFEPKPPMRETTLQKLNQIVFDPLFIGRRREFREFYNKLYDNKLKKLLIFGEGGIGKSALAANFGLELRRSEYKLFDYSFKYGGDFEDFLLDMELELGAGNAEKFRRSKEQGYDDGYKAKRIIKILLAEYPKVAFIFDNLESVQNADTGELEDKTIRAWIEAIEETEGDIALLLTTRWRLPDCKEYIQLGKPLKGDFLQYIASQNIDFSEKSTIDSLYETLGGNYRGTEFFIKAVKGMSLRDEELFLEKLSNAAREAQIDMAIGEILSHRTKEEIELLYRLTVYFAPIPRDGVRKISQDLPVDSLDTLVLFSLVEESFNHAYQTKEYQISALVSLLIAKEVQLSADTVALAAEYQLYLFLNERKTASQAIVAYEALAKAGRVKELELWLFDESNHKDMTLKGLVLNQIAVRFIGVADYDTALKYLEQSLKIRQATGNNEGEGAMLNNISLIYIVKGKYDDALKLLNYSLEISQAMGDKETEGMALTNIGEIHRRRGGLDVAKKYFEQSLKMQQSIGNKEGEGLALNNISQIYKARGDLSIALAYLKQSLEIRQSVGNKKGEGVTLNNIGAIYKASGNLPVALSYMERSLKIQQAIGDKAGEGVTLNNISQIHKAKGDLDKALTYLEQSLKILQAIGDKTGEGEVLNSIGLIYLERYRRLDTAKAYLEQSLKIRQALGDKAGICYTLFNMGCIYWVEKNVKGAYNAWIEVYTIASEIGLAEILVALEDLGAQLGVPNGLDGWAALAQRARE